MGLDELIQAGHLFTAMSPTQLIARVTKLKNLSRRIFSKPTSVFCSIIDKFSKKGVMEVGKVQLSREALPRYPVLLS